MAFLSQTPSASAAPSRARGLLKLPPLNLWLSLHRQRRALARLYAHALRDIGLDAQSARNEAAKPFWDVPNHWAGS